MFESQAYPLEEDIGRDASQHLPADTKHNTTVGRLCQWVGGLTNVKENGKGVREMRGVFPPPRRRHFPTGGGCARKSEVAVHTKNRNIHIKLI